MSNLTYRKLLAIEEALCARLAGAIDHDGPPVQRDYEHALSWVQQELERRLAAATSLSRRISDEA